MNPTRLRSWVRKYGRMGVLFVACLLGLHHLWTKRRTTTIVSVLLLCTLVGLCWSNHTVRFAQRRTERNPMMRQFVPANVSPTRPASTADTLAAELRAGFRQYPDSYQRFLWHSFHATWKALEDQEWAQIEPSLKAQGFHLEEQGTPGRYNVTLEGLAYQLSNAPKHELVIDFQVSPKVSRTTPTKMTIRLIGVSLSAKFNQPFSDLVRQSPYPKGSILDAFLQLAELTKIAAHYPLLDTIELEYHQPQWGRGVAYSEDDSVPYGYRISVDFMRYEHGAKSSKGMDFEAPSELDPPLTLGSKVQSEGFVSKDTFGKIVKSHCEWGSVGGPPEGGLIERIDRKPWPERDPVDLRTAYSIADLKSLPADTRSLKLMDDYLTNADLAELARFKELNYLDMFQCEGDPNNRFNERGLQVLVKLTKLKHLELQGDDVTDRVCKTISGVKRLTYLRLSGDNITDAGIRHLAALPRLEDLTVYGKQLADPSLHTIGTMHGLRNLTILYSEEFSDAGLNALRGLKHLEDLSIGTSKHVTSHGFAFLSHLPALTHLSLEKMPLDDEVLDSVSRLTQLKSLDLMELSGISDAGILRLHTLGRIEWLYVFSCPKVTSVGMRRLKTALPGQYTMD